MGKNDTKNGKKVNNYAMNGKKVLNYTQNGKMFKNMPLKECLQKREVVVTYYFI